MKKWHSLVVLAALVVFCAVPAQAGQWYVGAGLNSVSLGEDLGDIDSGLGLVFNFGYYFKPTFALDFVLGFSGHEDPFGDELLYTRLDIGAEFAFATGSSVVPYLVVGLAGNSMDYDLFTESFTGTSLFLGGGFDYYITPGHSVDFGLRFHAWEFDIESGGLIWVDVGDATTTVLSVMYNYHFIM